VSGKLRLSTDQYAQYLPGTRLRLTGKLSDPPVFPDFDYRSYLTRHDIVATMSRPGVELLSGPSRWTVSRNAAELRLALDHSLQRSLPEPEASLAGGIAFGRDGGISDELYSDFRDTGLAHIVAVSGSNVTLVTAIVFFLSTWVVGRRWAMLPAALMVVLYLFVAGLSASVVRAGVMALVFLFGAWLGRQQSGLAALGAAAIIMTAYQPEAAQDLGFQLSLAATAGLIVFGPWIRYGLERLGNRWARWLPRRVIEIVALSTSATLATLPIVWLNFGRVSVVGPLANIVVEPLFVVAFVLSALSAGVGVVWGPGGWAIGVAAYYPLSFITWFARTAASLPFAAFDVPTTNGSVALIAFLLVCVAGWFAYRRYAPVVPARPVSKRKRQTAKRLTWAGGVAMVAIAAVPVTLLPMRSSGELRVTVLDADSGDAVLFTTPNGKHVLVDAGPSGIVAARELGGVLPHWERRLDAVFALQPQAQHAGGVEGVLERFKVARLFGTSEVGDIGGRALKSLAAGDRYDVDGVRFEVLWPAAGFEGKDPNDGAMVLRVTYGATSVLLAGNLSAASQEALMAAADVRASVLLVPHHGANKTDAPFLSGVHPSLAVIPVEVTRFSSGPADTTLAALAGATVFRTDESGRVTVSSNGQRLRFDTER
jgi:competence protein ComEC